MPDPIPAATPLRQCPPLRQFPVDYRRAGAGRFGQHYATDIYAPSFRHLPDFFGTHAGMVKLTISLNVLMFGIGQMFHGPLTALAASRCCWPLSLCSRSAVSPARVD